MIKSDGSMEATLVECSMKNCSMLLDAEALSRTRAAGEG